LAAGTKPGAAGIIGMAMREAGLEGAEAFGKQFGQGAAQGGFELGQAAKQSAVEAGLGGLTGASAASSPAACRRLSRRCREPRSWPEGRASWPR
jgi:hypothetical protein